MIHGSTASDTIISFSFENRVVKFTNATLNRRDSHIALDTASIIQAARVDCSVIV